MITTTGNVAPREVAGITQAAQSGDGDLSRSLHYALLPLMEALFLESNPIPVKAALAILGRIPEPTLRLPLTEISKPNRDRLEAALARLEADDDADVAETQSLLNAAARATDALELSLIHI